MKSRHQVADRSQHSGETGRLVELVDHSAGVASAAGVVSPREEQGVAPGVSIGRASRGSSPVGDRDPRCTRRSRPDRWSAGPGGCCTNGRGEVHECVSLRGQQAAASYAHCSPGSASPEPSSATAMRRPTASDHAAIVIRKATPLWRSQQGQGRQHCDGRVHKHGRLHG